MNLLQRGSGGKSKQEMIEAEKFFAGSYFEDAFLQMILEFQVKPL
jgi:hypothetical protein